MSFSWWCKDQSGNDLFKEFDINSQALCFAFENSPRSTEDIRSAFYAVPYKDKIEDAARDSINFAQALVMENINAATGFAHLECPCCTCARDDVKGFMWNLEEARRFCKIPLTRVWRAGGGW